MRLHLINANTCDNALLYNIYEYLHVCRWYNGLLRMFTLSIQECLP